MIGVTNRISRCVALSPRVGMWYPYTPEIVIGVERVGGWGDGEPNSVFQCSSTKFGMWYAYTSKMVMGS